jgi:hypothetical protein
LNKCSLKLFSPSPSLAWIFFHSHVQESKQGLIFCPSVSWSNFLKEGTDLADLDVFGKTIPVSYSGWEEKNCNMWRFYLLYESTEMVFSDRNFVCYDSIEDEY